MAKVGFNYNEPGKPEPIYFEQVFAEKPGGGIVAAPEFDIFPTTAVGFDDNGKLKPIKCYRVVEDAEAGATSIKIEKGSGVAKNDIIAKGKVGVKATAVNSNSEYFDVVTVSLGVAVKAGDRLYQAAAESAEAGEGTEAVDAAPIYTPKYVTGAVAHANDGDQLIRLINGANLRKETAHVADEVVELLKNIELV